MATANRTSIEAKVYQGIAGLSDRAQGFPQVKLGDLAYNNIKLINDIVGLQSVSLVKT
ncbi:MAG: hypothetical protein WAL97_05930 [Halobacteriota archaeon]